MNERVRRRLKSFLIAAGGIVVLLIAFVMSIPFLFAPDNAAPSDLLLHLSSDARLQGDAHAAQLYRQGIAKQIVCAGSQISWDVYPTDASRDHIVELGIPGEAVSVLHLPITDCGAELLPYLIKEVRAREAKSVLMLVDPTVTRIGVANFRKRFAAEGIEARVTFAAGDRDIMLQRWWTSHWKAQRVIGTLMNTALDLLYAPCR